MRTAVTTISITPAPRHVWAFKGTAARIHRRGHIWLNNDTAPVTLSFQLPANFLFKPNANGDAMCTSSDPNKLTRFDPCNGVFANLCLQNGNTELKFDVTRFDGNVYYYLFNVFDALENATFVIDPIIVNK